MYPLTHPMIGWRDVYGWFYKMTSPISGAKKLVKLPRVFTSYRKVKSLPRRTTLNILLLSYCNNVHVPSSSAVSNSLQPMDCNLPGPSVHGILPARILEWVATFSSSRRSFLTPGLNLGLLHCRQILYHLSCQGNPITTSPIILPLLLWKKKNHFMAPTQRATVSLVQ